jgi:hypothetical protein
MSSEIRMLLNFAPIENGRCWQLAAGSDNVAIVRLDRAGRCTMETDQPLTREELTLVDLFMDSRGGTH